PALLPYRHRRLQALRRVSTASVATSATAAATGRCRVRRLSEAVHNGQLWADVLTGNLQFGQRASGMATPVRVEEGRVAGRANICSCPSAYTTIGAVCF
ncbi:MAG: hypothetical protein WD031_01260, partial [Gemmatimonadota bacterium]